MKRQTIVYILFFIAFISLFIVWTIDHDEKVQIGADKYELCVKSQYGVSPAYYYQEHGEYPECK